MAFWDDRLPFSIQNTVLQKFGEIYCYNDYTPLNSGNFTTRNVPVQARCAFLKMHIYPRVHF